MQPILAACGHWRLQVDSSDCKDTRSVCQVILPHSLLHMHHILLTQQWKSEKSTFWHKIGVIRNWKSQVLAATFLARWWLNFFERNKLCRVIYSTLIQYIVSTKQILLNQSLPLRTIIPVIHATVTPPSSESENRIRKVPFSLLCKHSSASWRGMNPNRELKE